MSALRGVALLATLAVAPGLLGAQNARAVGGEASYWAYVANESSDIVSLVRFDGTKVVEEKAITVGAHPADIDGAHGITVSPSGTHWYVSIAHGRPFGQIWKMETGTDAFVDSAVVGLFPATMATTPDGASLFVVNFNLHGDHVPSSVSTVFTPLMSEVKQIETCVMPHGSRISHDGTRHYSTCMMSDQLVETDVQGLAVSRRMVLTGGQEHVMAGDHAMAMDGDHAMSGMAMNSAQTCKPTWVLPSPDDARLYVPCNGRGDVLEIDAHTMRVLRKFPTGSGPYNADITPDGAALVVTLKGGQAVAIIDLATGEQRKVATTQPVTHGVSITPDGRYAFVSNEAVGATRGTVDVIDLTRAAVVASTPLHYQPGGIAVWKMERPAEVEILPDIVYGHKDGMALTYDVLRPSDPNGAAVALMVSGGWVSEWSPPDEWLERPIVQELTGRGFTVALVRHGSSPRFKVPDAVADARLAIADLRERAGSLGVDPARLGVMGYSAGGHLSLSVGLRAEGPGDGPDAPAEARENQVAAIVAYFPPVDLRGWAGPSERFPALDFESELEVDASPILFATSDDPPTLLLHGDEDGLVPLAHSERMNRALADAGVTTEFVVFPGAGHGFRGEDAVRGVALTVEWFERWLGG